MRLILVAGLVGCSDFKLGEIGPDGDSALGELAVDPGRLDFGARAPGEASEQAFTITSIGGAAVTLRGIELDGSSAYTLTNLSAEAEVILAPGDALEVIVGYAPATLDDDASAIILSDAVNPELEVELDGAGLYPVLAVDPPALSVRSAEGEAVTAELTITSAGTADLELTQELLLGERFSLPAAEAALLPLTLPPGAEHVLTVTYTPLEEDEEATGELWLGSNADPSSTLVPLQGQVAPPCVGLGEGWDRGVLDVYTDPAGGTIILENLTDNQDLCVDQWYVYLSTGSQDAGVGDPYYDVGAEYPLGTIAIPPGEAQRFEYERPGDPAWWCMEKTQYMAPTSSYEFTGAHVPEPLLSLMLDENQDAVWAWMATNPVPIVGHLTHYGEIDAEDGGAISAGIRVVNMGGLGAVVEVRETVPAGFLATGFSQEPLWEGVAEDGSTTYSFLVELAARVETDLYTHTIYDEERITYSVVPTDGACKGRAVAGQLRGLWEDAEGASRVSTGSPLILRCL